MTKFANYEHNALVQRFLTVGPGTSRLEFVEDASGPMVSLFNCFSFFNYYYYYYNYQN